MDHIPTIVNMEQEKIDNECIKRIMRGFHICEGKPSSKLKRVLEEKGYSVKSQFGPYGYVTEVKRV